MNANYHEQRALHELLLKRGAQARIANAIFRTKRWTIAGLAADLLKSEPEVLHSKNIGGTTVAILRNALAPEMEAIRRGEPISIEEAQEPPLPIEERLIAVLREFIRAELKKASD